jgi:hypothetical protein
MDSVFHVKPIVLLPVPQPVLPLVSTLQEQPVLLAYHHLHHVIPLVVLKDSTQVETLVLDAQSEPSPVPLLPYTKLVLLDSSWELEEFVPLVQLVKLNVQLCLLLLHVLLDISYQVTMFVLNVLPLPLLLVKLNV